MDRFALQALSVAYDRCVRVILVGVALALAAGCRSQTMPSDTAPVRVLFFSATAGFRHDSIASARTALASLASSTGEFSLKSSEDPSALEADRLAGFDVVHFAMTSGELPLTAGQQAALLAFVQDGHGFIGTHSATDTLYTWPEYGALVGAYFKDHPWTQTATVRVEDPSHPISSGLGPSFAIQEEFYTFRDNPRGSVHVLLSLDAASVGAAGDFPLAWTNTLGRGRVYYNALGHFPATWNEARFLNQIRAAIRWTSGRD
jgi:uncharacterized protein